MFPPCADTINRAINKPNPMLLSSASHDHEQGFEDGGSTSGEIVDRHYGTARRGGLAVCPQDVTGVPAPCCIAFPRQIDTTWAVSGGPARLQVSGRFQLHDRVGSTNADLDYRFVAQLRKIDPPSLERNVAT